MRPFDLWMTCAVHGPAIAKSTRGRPRVHAVDTDHQWPPNLKDLAEGVERCTECHAKYPRRRRAR